MSFSFQLEEMDYDVPKAFGWIWSSGSFLSDDAIK